MIIEAHSIRSREKERCVSTASLALSDFEKKHDPRGDSKKVGFLSVLVTRFLGSRIRCCVFGGCVAAFHVLQ